MPVTIYKCDTLPAHWVIEHEGQLWLVPAVQDGWQKRSRYHGHRAGLQQVSSGYLAALGVGIERNAGDQRAEEPIRPGSTTNGGAYLVQDTGPFRWNRPLGLWVGDPPQKRAYSPSEMNELLASGKAVPIDDE